jgi:hypothetical protein
MLPKMRKDFAVEYVFIGDRLVEDLHHRMDRRGNISLNIFVTTSVRHSLYHTSEEEGSPMRWDDIEVDSYCKKLAIMDTDVIILNKSTKGLKNNRGNTVSEEQQLKGQRIRYAKASKFNGTSTLTKRKSI